MRTEVSLPLRHLEASAHAFRTLCLSVVVAVTLWGLGGCGGGPGDQPDLGTVEGTVTLDGQPLPDATVTFQPDKGRPSAAVTDAQGHYALEYTPDTPGAKVGQHKVTISTLRMVYEGDEEREVPEKVPAEYNTESTLQKDVQAGPNQIDFDLKSEGA